MLKVKTGMQYAKLGSKCDIVSDLCAQNTCKQLAKY
jgi:hypothetical protein